jgi:hypothetical protein
MCTVNVYQPATVVAGFFASEHNELNPRITMRG